MSPGQKTNPQSYALRLHNVVTKEVLWMPRDTTITQVVAHISNPSCPNADCPNNDKSGGSMVSAPVQAPAAVPSTSTSAAAAKKLQQQQQKANNSNAGVHANSVWRAELRVRYVPTNLHELYEKDRTTSHFYFDQVSSSQII